MGTTTTISKRLYEVEVGKGLHQAIFAVDEFKAIEIVKKLGHFFTGYVTCYPALIEGSKGWSHGDWLEKYYKTAKYMEIMINQQKQNK